MFLLEKCAYELNMLAEMTELAMRLNKCKELPRDEYLARRLAEQTAGLYIKQSKTPPAELVYPLAEILNDAKNEYMSNAEYDKYADCLVQIITLLEAAVGNAAYMEQFSAVMKSEDAGAALNKLLKHAKAEQEEFIKTNVQTLANPAQGYNTVNTVWLTAVTEREKNSFNARNKQDAAELCALPKDTELTDGNRREYISRIERRLINLTHCVKELQSIEINLPQN